MRYKYQFSLNFQEIGKPFPANDMKDAVDIILKRHFKKYKPIITHANIDALELMYITIVVPGRKKLTYSVMKTGLIARDQVWQPL